MGDFLPNLKVAGLMGGGAEGEEGGEGDAGGAVTTRAGGLLLLSALICGLIEGVALLSAGSCLFSSSICN